MFGYLRDIFRQKSTPVLLAGSLFSILLLLVRINATGRIFFLFMLWNLFLAFIPWFLGSIIQVRKIKKRWVLLPFLLCWIIFFPNAPYILTDLIHLKTDNGAPLWYDLILLLSFGFTGLLYGFVSLKIISGLLEENLRKFWKNVIITGLIYISSFGIYLGRFLRWNSWDIINNPGGLLRDISVRLVDPFTYQSTWIFTLLYGTLMVILYWGFESFGKTEKMKADTE